jgi:cytochrome c biogenesis factor
LIHSIESLKALENYMIKYFPIFLETFSFFLVTFDLYYQNKEVAFNTIGKTMAMFAVASIIPPFIVYVLLIFPNILGYIDLQRWISFAEPIFCQIFWVVTLPIVISAIIITLISSRFKEDKKPRFIAFGCILFILSKTFSVYLLN